MYLLLTMYLPREWWRDKSVDVCSLNWLTQRTHSLSWLSKSTHSLGWLNWLSHWVHSLNELIHSLNWLYVHSAPLLDLCECVCHHHNTFQWIALCKFTWWHGKDGQLTGYNCKSTSYEERKPPFEPRNSGLNSKWHESLFQQKWMSLVGFQVFSIDALLSTILEFQFSCTLRSVGFWIN